MAAVAILNFENDVSILEILVAALQCFFVQNLMKLGQLVIKLQLFCDIQDGGRHPLYWCPLPALHSPIGSLHFKVDSRLWYLFDVMSCCVCVLNLLYLVLTLLWLM